MMSTEQPEPTWDDLPAAVAYAGGSSTDAVDDGPAGDELGAELAGVPEPPMHPGAEERWQGHTHLWPELDGLDPAEPVSCVECGLTLPAGAARGDHEDDPEAVPDGG